MARLESDLKLGFYPTSTSTLRKFTDKIVLKQEDKIKVFDPCCGNGEALEFLGQFFDATTYGVELDDTRSKEAINRVNFFINASAFEMMRTTKSFEFLFLNPPYGTHIVNEKETRLEISFVDFFANSVAIGGYLLLVVSYKLFKDFSSYRIGLLLSNLDFRVETIFFDEENEDYKNYGQYFILLKRAGNKIKKESKILEKNLEVGNKFLQEMDFSKAVSINSIKQIELNIKKANIHNFNFRSFSPIKEWQIGKALEKHILKFQNVFSKMIEKKTAVSNFASIDEPNDGQSVILITNGLVENAIANFLLKGICNKRKVVNKNALIDRYEANLFGFSEVEGKYYKFI